MRLPKQSKQSPIALVNNETEPYEQPGQHVISAGFGYECPGFGPAHYTDAIVTIDRTSCQKELNKYLHPVQHPWNLTDFEICAQDAAGHSGAGVGDSGGPLFHQIR